MAKHRSKPITFFLNEAHELSPSEKEGGGGLPKYTPISWAAKATRLSNTLQTVSTMMETSRDPLKDDRYFILALPVPEVEKKSENKRKYPKGTFKEPTDFGGDHSKVFDRLGLDLLQVTDDGKAVVHADKEKFDQILHRAASLESLGPREQSRWATIDSFEIVPLELRVDASWLQALPTDEAADIVIELQPVLSRQDADRVLRALADLLAQRSGEKLTGTGTDFSGRHWFRGRASRQSIRRIAKDFFSVQSVHAPLYSMATAKAGSRSHGQPKKRTTPTPPADTSNLPCVAVVDLGIPTDHVRLRPYRRGQFYAQDAPRAAVGNHGSVVASRVVLGDWENDEGLLNASGQCAFFDTMVAERPGFSLNVNRVNDKLVMDALQGTRGASPDVRVFNLSFGDVRALDEFPTVEKREKRVMLRDLDNFIFFHDCVVVVAAGNSRPGVPPNQLYPDHYDDPRWALGPWACGFNTWVCGSYVSKLSTNGLVETIGWPSPFTRIGPGLCDSPVPSFCAPGGNTDDTYRSRSGHGVLGLSASGLVEDHIGTSQAAPILAREAAFALHELQKFCVPGTQPFAVTARAFLTLTANHPVQDQRVKTLVERTLGNGQASIQRLLTPAVGSAVILWQGHIESQRDKVRVQLPIPLEWLAEAEKPVLRLVVCSDTPVNEAAQGSWACRKIVPRLYLGPDAQSATAPRGSHPTFPVIDRHYALDRYKPGEKKAAEGDLWLLEISYDEIFPYPPGMDFDPRQRVAFAAELFDQGAAAVDPQSAMQALPIASTLNRLSIQPTAIRTPIVIKTRV